MIELSSHTNQEEIKPLQTRMKTSWLMHPKKRRKCTLRQPPKLVKLFVRVMVIVICPNDGQNLFQAVQEHKRDCNLDFLTAAYRNTTSKKIKTQILSLYAYEYPANKLIEMHSSFEKLSERQIEKARAHAKTFGPGTPVETTKKHRIYLNKAKVDHFIEFSNRPYFYQDVSYGTRVLELESGERLTMPNVIRTVTKSTQISEYQKHCTETEFSPLSRATLFRILDVREASQRKSLHGLDNSAADGSSAFDSMENILNSLQQASNEKISWFKETRKSLRPSKKYVKTDFRVANKSAFCPLQEQTLQKWQSVTRKALFITFKGKIPWVYDVLPFMCLISPYNMCSLVWDGKNERAEIQDDRVRFYIMNHLSDPCLWSGLRPKLKFTLI